MFYNMFIKSKGTKVKEHSTEVQCTQKQFVDPKREIILLRNGNNWGRDRFRKLFGR